MDDEPDVAADANRPEVPVPRLVEPMELHARVRRIHLQVERRRLDGLLLVARQPREAVGERVSDAKVHEARDFDVPDMTLPNSIPI
jgi:hypothetical protein